MTNNKLTDVALDECKKRSEARLIVAKALGNEYQALNIAATISALTELQERRKADSAKPFGYYSAEVPTIFEQQGYASITRDCAGEYRFPLYATPQPLNDAERAELEQYRKNYQWREQLGEGEGP